MLLRYKSNTILPRRLPVHIPICMKTQLAAMSEYLRKCAPSDDSDHTAHSRSLIRIFTGRILDSQECKISFFADNEDSDQTAWMRRLI